MQQTTAADVVRAFWRLMGSNDFHAVRAVLAPTFVLEWPQSRERIRGGAITRLVEFWPDPYEPPAHRAHLVERLP